MDAAAGNPGHNMNYAVLILILMLLAVGSAAQDSRGTPSFLCVPDKSVGFVFNAKTATWDKANFAVEGQKYIVRPMRSDDLNVLGIIGAGLTPYAVWEFGRDSPIAMCKGGIEQSGWLRCRVGALVDFSLNIESSRFVYTFHGDYATATLKFDTDEEGKVVTTKQVDKGGDTPFIKIGKCSQL